MDLAARFWRALKLVTSLGLALGPTNARASDGRQAIEQRIRMQPGDQCPTAAAIAAETWALTPADRRAILEELRDVLIEDLGASYRVVVTTTKGTKERVYPGPERDCEKRARFVAVFVVLTLMPPEGQPTEEQAVQPTSPATPPPPLPDIPRLGPDAMRFLRLELAAMVEQGMPLDGATGIRCVGGSLRAQLGRGVVAPSFGVSYAPDAHFDEGAVQGNLARATAAAGLRARLRSTALELGADAGALVVASRATATNLANPASDAGIEVGIEATLVVAVRTKIPVEPFLATTVQWIPAPHRLATVPRGDIGALPQLWIGASAGVALSL